MVILKERAYSHIKEQFLQCTGDSDIIWILSAQPNFKFVKHLETVVDFNERQ